MSARAEFGPVIASGFSKRPGWMLADKRVPALKQDR
jgi:hypothetical protein